MSGRLYTGTLILHTNLHPFFSFSVGKLFFIYYFMAHVAPFPAQYFTCLRPTLFAIAAGQQAYSRFG